jgi:hypothetical protein
MSRRGWPSFDDYGAPARFAMNAATVELQVSTNE